MPGSASGRVLPLARSLKRIVNLLAPGRVLGVGEELLVRTDLARADLEKIVPLRHHRHVEQHLLGGVGRAAAANVHRIFAARREARLIPAVPVLHGHAGVIGRDAAGDFLVQRLAQRGGMRGHLREVVVFRLEVVEDFGPAARVVAQPVVVVDARARRRGHRMRMNRRHRRQRRRRLLLGRRRAGEEERARGGNDEDAQIESRRHERLRSARARW